VTPPRVRAGSVLVSHDVPVPERPFVISRSNTPAPAPAAPAEPRADGVSPLRVAVWVVIALVLATGVVLYFRHQNDVAPVLGAAVTAGGTEAGHR
jgi:hypothetical protein